MPKSYRQWKQWHRNIKQVKIWNIFTLPNLFGPFLFNLFGRSLVKTSCLKSHLWFFPTRHFICILFSRMYLEVSDTFQLQKYWLACNYFSLHLFNHIHFFLISVSCCTQFVLKVWLLSISSWNVLLLHSVCYIRCACISLPWLYPPSICFYNLFFKKQKGGLCKVN